MTTAERLNNYSPVFGDAIVGDIQDIADRQANMSYQQLFDWVGVPVKPTVHNKMLGYGYTELYDIRRPHEDPEAALMIHLAMAQPLDPNQIYQVATIAAANPNSRVFVAGKPSSRRFGKSGELDRGLREQVAHGYRLPATLPLLRYVEEQAEHHPDDIKKVNQYGYSAGADEAVAAASYGGVDASHVVALEPASVVKRNLLRLGMAFASTGKHLQEYYDANELDAYDAARDKKASTHGMSYNFGLANLTNIAIARGIASGSFQKELERAFYKKPNLQATVAWGTESELVPDSGAQNMVRDVNRYIDQLEADRGAHLYGRVLSLRLDGQHHALANDVHLQAAVVRHGLEA